MNKKYSKENYEALTAKIREHMDMMPYVDKKGRVYRYGEFFPIEIAQFAYNETIANNFFPLLKEEMEKEGYRYAESEERNYAITKSYTDLPDCINDVSDDIPNEVIGCKVCERGYRITAMELSFLRQMRLPLPRECPFCRIDAKFKQWVKNLRMIPRVCDKCGADFTTNYTEEEAPHILCRECYKKEVV